MTDISLEQMEAKLKTLLRRLGLYGVRFSPEDLASALAQERGWRVVMTPIDNGGAFGAVVLSDGVLLVLYRKDITPFHRDYVIFHELGHVILGHLEDREGPLSYDIHEERDAEMVAQVLMKLATGNGRYNDKLQSSYQKLFE